MKLYKSKSWLERKLFREHKTVDQIAAECSTSRVTIYQWIKRHGIRI